MASRADRIFEILQQSKNRRLKVSEIHARLAKLEATPKEDLHPSIIPATVRQDNKTRRFAGKAVRFSVYNDGDEQRGWVSIPQVANKTVRKDILATYLEEIPSLVEEANERVREQLKQAVSELSWQDFESNFLPQILEALGFSEVEITQPTRDGGRDALCTYRRGVVRSQAIVSAKHWAAASVGPDEVQRLRGIRGNADTGIIVTSSRFTQGAQAEAEPSQNQRAVVLIDGDLIVDTCLRYGIGVRPVALPSLYKFTGLVGPGHDLD